MPANRDQQSATAAGAAAVEIDAARSVLQQALKLLAAVTPRGLLGR